MDIYVFRADIVATAPPPDVTGWDVEATDGHIGKVDEATYENRSGCLVVDTGFWIFGKQRLLPGGVVTAIDPDEKKVYVGMSKADIKSAPDYDPTATSPTSRDTTTPSAATTTGTAPRRKPRRRRHRAAADAHGASLGLDPRPPLSSERRRGWGRGRWRRRGGSRSAGAARSRCRSGRATRSCQPFRRGGPGCCRRVHPSR